MSEPRGATRISVHLREVTEDQVDRLAEAICDLVTEHGFGNAQSFRSIVSAEAWEWPASDADAFIEELNMRGGPMWLPDADPDGIDD